MSIEESQEYDANLHGGGGDISPFPISAEVTPYLSDPVQSELSAGRAPKSDYGHGSLMTPKRSGQLSPKTPMSDFHCFAETSLSPLTPPRDPNSILRPPTSRDWALYQTQLHGANNIAGEFVSTKKQALPSASISGAALLGDMQLDGAHKTEGFVSTDQSIQAQLISNARALVARLAMGKSIRGDASPSRDGNSVVRRMENGVKRDVHGSADSRQSSRQTSHGAASHEQEWTRSQHDQKKRRVDDKETDCEHIGQTINEFNFTVDRDSIHHGSSAGSTNQGLEVNQLRSSNRVQSANSSAAAWSLSGTPPTRQLYSEKSMFSYLPSRSLADISAYPDVSPGCNGEVNTFAPGESPVENGDQMKDGPDASPAMMQFRPVSCNCKKSRCLKLYCDCFRLQKYCDGCNCSRCANLPECEEDRQRSMISIMERNPEAFKPRITSNNQSPTKASSVTSTEGTSPSLVQFHFSGCHCKKSACLKKYCECYQAQIPCQARCRCQDCRNTVADGLFSDIQKKEHDLSPRFIAESSALLTPGGPDSSAAPAPGYTLLSRGNKVEINRSGGPLSVDRSGGYYMQRQESLIRRGEVLMPGERARRAGATGIIGPDLSATSDELSPVFPISNTLISSAAKESSTLSESDTSPSSSGTARKMIVPCVSAISVEVIAAVLAARLKGLDSSGGGLSQEECIREELLRLQREGYIVSPQDSSKTHPTPSIDAASSSNVEFIGHSTV